MKIEIVDKIVASFQEKYPNAQFAAWVLGDKTITLEVSFFQMSLRHKIAFPELEQARIDLMEHQFERMVKEVARRWNVRAQIDLENVIVKGAKNG